jgi:hypothetical protein
VIRFLSSLFQRRAPSFGRRRAARGRFRDPRFVSFLSDFNRKTLDTDFQDAVLRGRRLFKQGLIVALAAGGAWIVLESARALSIF